MRVFGAGIGVDRNRHAVLEGEAAVAGDVIGMRVRFEHAGYPQPSRRGLLDERLDCVRGVDEDSLARLLVTDQV